MLLAIRDLQIKVVKDFMDVDSDTVTYDFRKRKLSPKEIEDLIIFFERTGLKRFFQNFSCQSIQDYIAGVEVGLDTHARKNRSGKAMELVVDPIIQTIVKQRKLPFQIENQRYFRYLPDHYHIPVSSSLFNRKTDFMLIGNKGKIVNIEVNFFSGTGSKPQEIVDSYINRQNELYDNGFDFIWITDGLGWKGQKNQIRKGLEMIDYPLNLHFVRKGLLERILCQIASTSR
ncbi:MAG: type restriction enzyme [Candidatus Atribacteria bacterium]|nr:type restriction enzyme [Candidatus Atribacteria bacterium]